MIIFTILNAVYHHLTINMCTFCFRYGTLLLSNPFKSLQSCLKSKVLSLENVYILKVYLFYKFHNAMCIEKCPIWSFFKVGYTSFASKVWWRKLHSCCNLLFVFVFQLSTKPLQLPVKEFSTTNYYWALLSAYILAHSNSN